MCIPCCYVGWGTFGIQGMLTPLEKGTLDPINCIRIKNNDAADLFAAVEEGTPVKAYGGPYGAFGTGYRNLNYGDRGSDVYEVEKRLKDQGYYKGSVEGIYNEALKIAIHTFQKDKELKITDSIGKEFYEKLGILIE
jgi:hypothetical protein